jgi:hypothetical protein
MNEWLCYLLKYFVEIAFFAAFAKHLYLYDAVHPEPDNQKQDNSMEQLISLCQSEQQYCKKWVVSIPLTAGAGEKAEKLM